MKRLTREEVRVERLLRATRSIAVLGADPRHGARSGAVVEYLKQAGFDVFPVHANRAEIAGLASWASLADVPGSVDLVLVVDGSLERGALDEVGLKGARILWLQPGVLADGVDALAEKAHLVVVRDHDIVTEHRHTEQVAGQPRKRGVNVAGRKGWYQDDRKRRDDTWHVEGGGGGHKGGGGQHAVLDEKKMVGGRPSPRRGPMRTPE